MKSKPPVLLAALALALAPLAATAQPALPTKEPAKPAAPAKPPAAEPVATVNGVAVPRSRMDLLLNQQLQQMQQQGQRAAMDNEQVREQLRAQVRDELVNREVVAQEAQRTGVGRSADVQAQIDMARQEILVGAYIREYVRRNPVSDAEIQKEYDRVRSQAGDREYKARHILVESEDQARSIIAELGKGAKFEDLASRNSKDSGSAARGGDLDWNVPSVFDRQFSDAMVKLEKGKVTDAPVRTRFGFHVIRLDDVRSVKFPPLAEVRPRIQQQLTQGKIEEMVRGLRAKAKVE